MVINQIKEFINNLIKDLSFDDLIGIVLISSIVSHLIAWFYFNWVHNYWVIYIGWTLHTILWTPLVLYFFWFGTIRVDVVKEVYNFLFYWEYVNPFFEFLFIKIEKITGKNPVPFYIKKEETLKLIERTIYWMNEYDRLVLKQLENEHRLLDRDYHNYNRIYAGRHPRVPLYQKRLMFQDKYILKQYNVFWQMEDVFSYALENKKNLRYAWIRYSRNWTEKKWSNWRETFAAFHVRSLEKEKPWYIVW